MSRSVKISAGLFLIGSVGYSLIEILWRGFTHWTMAVTGGICFLAVYHATGRCPSAPLWKKCLLSSGVITAVEFVVGCVVNLQLGWRVWSYAGMPLNLMGQICPLFSGLWFLLSIPLIGLTNRLRRTFSPPSGALAESLSGKSLRRGI